MLLSGFVFPISNMPVVLQGVCQAVPATWFIEGVKALMLKGAEVAELWLPLTVLGGMAVGLIGVALVLFVRGEKPRR